MIEALQHRVLEHSYHNLLPEREEQCDLNSQELEQRGVRSKRFLQRMVEQHQIIQRISDRDTHNPLHRPSDPLRQRRLLVDKEIQKIQKQRGSRFYYQKLQNVLLASISKILGFLPGGELVRFLEVVHRKEMRYFFLVANHNGVQAHIV